MTIKTWFLNKNFDALERIAISGTEPTVERETEKAMLLKWNTEYGIIKRWVPKSCIESTPAVSEELLKAAAEYAKKQEEKEASFVKGARVKKIGGRKIFTVTSSYVTYGGVWLDNGKHVSINELVLVA